LDEDAIKKRGARHLMHSLRYLPHQTIAVEVAFANDGEANVTSCAEQSQQKNIKTKPNFETKPNSETKLASSQMSSSNAYRRETF
jgi:hypothetical protein